MEECPKCEAKNISISHQAKGEEKSYNRPIDGVKKFMRDDTYYYADQVKTEHLIYKCETCGYRVAKPTKDALPC